MLDSESRWEDIRCRRIVWSAAESIEARPSMMPQYQLQRTVHGGSTPLCSTVGHDPVDVKQPVRSAAFSRQQDQH